MLFDALQKLAGVRPRKSARVSGTRAKLLLKRRPKKALKLHGQIQSRGDVSKRKIASRQKNPKRKLYKSKVSRIDRLQRKLSFQRKGEHYSTLSDLMEQLRAMLQT